VKVRGAHVGAILSLSLLFVSLVGSHAALAADAKDPGSIGIRIAEIPSAVADNPLARVYIIDRLHPSKVVTQRIEVFNTSSVDLPVNLYPGAAKFTNGEFVALAGRAGNDLTRWITISPNKIVVKPGTYVSAQITFSTPADAPSIQQYGVIWAEVRGATKNTGITSVSRVGIRMYVPVGDSAEEDIGVPVVNSSTNQIVVRSSGTPGFIIYIVYLATFIGFLYMIAHFFRIYLARRKAMQHDRDEEKKWKAEKRRRSEKAKILKEEAEQNDEILDED